MDRAEPAFFLHVDFEAQARLTPGSIALHFAGTTITYAELAERAARVAGALGRRGIGAGCHVGLHVDRSIDYVASVLGILKANAAVVPLPPAYPRARIADILEFARLDAVVDHPGTPFAPVHATRVLHFADLVSEAEETATLEPGNPDQPAFVLASSGSTGKPKLIVRSHRSFYHRLRWTWANHPYGPAERCVQKSTMTTTHAIYELFEPLLRGVPTLVLGDDESRDLPGFWATINAWSATRLLVVPSALQVSLDFPGFAVPTMKVVVLMGEYVHQKLAGRALEAFPQQTSVYSIYGSTEASSSWSATCASRTGRTTSCRSAGRSRPRCRPTSWTPTWLPSPPARPACFISAVRRCFPNTSRTRNLPIRSLSVRPWRRSACTTPTTRFVSPRTATLSTSVARTTRSRCAASAWTSRKSSARCCCIPRSAMPRSY